MNTDHRAITMMARVSLGHTGRHIHIPPKLIQYAFIALVLASVFRVLLPYFLPSYYLQWLSLTGVFWVLTFAIFLWVYAPILWQANQSE